jgi:hypothetical protein
MAVASIIGRVRPWKLRFQRVARRRGLTRAEHLDADGEDGLDLIFATAGRSRSAYQPGMPAVRTSAACLARWTLSARMHTSGRGNGRSEDLDLVGISRFLPFSFVTALGDGARRR